MIGLYKAWPDLSFNLVRTCITLAIGGIAGALAALAFPWGEQLEAGEAVALITAGYAGADFIEGLLKDKLPGAEPNGKTDQDAQRVW